jgi:hypothetical protein
VTIPTPEARRDPLGRAVLAVAATLHLALLAYYTPLRAVFSNTPFHTYDYALHVYQVDRAARAFEGFGHLWSYDPFLLAGQPAGAVEDLTSKSLELFVIAARALGVRTWVAFDAYVLLVELGLPFVGYAAARLFDLSKRTASFVVLGWVLLWYFDSLLHWCWYVGMISWGAASYLIVLVVALLYRALRDHRPWAYASTGVVAALVTLIHPFAALTLVLPLGALYTRGFRRLRVWEHLALAFGTACAAATTLVWIGPALKFRHYIGTVDAFLWPTLPYVFFDWLDLLKDVLMTGQPVHTALRSVTLLLALGACARLARSRDDRFLPLVTLVFGSFALAYLSGYSSALRQTQPYRHVGPAVLAAALPAGAVLEHVFSRERVAALSRSARISLLLAALLAVPVLARTALGYLPTAIPARQAPRTALRPGPRAWLDNRELELVKLGLAGPERDYVDVGSYLDAHFTAASGRVAAFDWVLGEYLPVFTRLPALGGIPQRNIPHVAAHPLRFDFTPTATEPDPFRRYLRDYAVAAVVTTGVPGPVDFRRDLLEPMRAFGELRVYRVQEPSGYVAEGHARVTSQGLNSIRVADAERDVVLRFHFLETLRCRPRCRVERASAFRDAAGFLRVKSESDSFEIFNDYD